MVSFDVTSLFTSIPVDETMAIISNLCQGAGLPTQYIDWADCCLKSGYFLWRGDYYRQIDGVAMGSPIAPVVANIFMEWFEGVALKDAPVQPRYWWRYVDDVFAIVDRDSLSQLTTHLNSVHDKIKFTVEEEQDYRLPFLDVLVIRDASGSVSHTVYRKPTHTNRYLNANSHHHPSQLASVPKSLINRALTLCDPQHINTELKHVKHSLESNGYNWRQCSRWAGGTQNKKQVSVNRVPIYLPFIKGVTDKIGYILQRQYDIRAFYRPPSQLRQALRSPKDREPLNTPGVYQIPCDCGKKYIGETRRNISTRIKEHIRSVKNMDITKSAVAEHANEPNHYLRFDMASVLVKEKFLVPRKVREAIEINRHPNFNRDRGWSLAPAWGPVLNTSKYVSPNTEINNDTVSVVCTSLTHCGIETTDSEAETNASSELQPTTARARRAEARALRASSRLCSE